MSTDVEILTAFREDMDEGGRLLFQRYYKPLVLFSGSLLDCCDFPEDVVQDIFYQFIRTKAYRQILPEALGTYLFRCVKNASLNKTCARKVYSRAELLAYDAIEEETVTILPELIEAFAMPSGSCPGRPAWWSSPSLSRGKNVKRRPKSWTFR